MVGYPTFSALRLGRIFPPEVLEAYPFYIAVDPEGDFDEEYLGGQWHEELIDGVQLFFPSRDGNKLAVVEVWAGGCVLSAAVRDKPASMAATLVPPWTANANRVLEALGMPIRMGSPAAAVRALAAGKILGADFPDEWYDLYPAVAQGTLCSLLFACRAPEVYHMRAVVHSTEGLLKLEVRRPDLVRANGTGRAYDTCTKGLYDEGPG